MPDKIIIPFSDLGIGDIEMVGGKNASLGEIIKAFGPGTDNVPAGFASTAEAYRMFLRHNRLEAPIHLELGKLDLNDFSNINEVSDTIKAMIHRAHFPVVLEDAIKKHYRDLCRKYGEDVDVAVRSSATAEDLPSASFAGLHDSFLHRRGEQHVLDAVHCCFASLFNARAIKYRCDKGFDHMKISISAGVQIMVRSDLACSGTAFTLDTESGFRDCIVISGCWGLGENIVQGVVTPDEFGVFKPTLKAGRDAILYRKLGTKSKTLVYNEDFFLGVHNTDTPQSKQEQLVLTDAEVTQLARWSLFIEEHYKCPMDIEWAKDGRNGKLFILQARPETVHSSRVPYTIKEYKLKSEGKRLSTGSAVGSGIASGRARVLVSSRDASLLQPGEILVTDITNPDWDPVLKKAAAIVTNKGGRTSHAAIIAREMGTVAIVGTNDAMSQIHDGQEITVSCVQGRTGVVYDGKLDWEETEVNFQDFKMPQTNAMIILGDPEKAFRYSFYPNNGIGLMRLEFVISNAIGVHPMALCRFEDITDAKTKEQITRLTANYKKREDYFVEKLAEAIATVAAAFFPKKVVVRLSDFKTNEYANLLGGKDFEPQEENPMLGFRGASRYYHERYREGFRLECEALKKVRDNMGLTNVIVMVPFCRTVEEGKKVLGVMEEFGLKRGENGLEVYVMVEVPSNVILARNFAEIFDGFSIGSNDLTQLVLGLDRDSAYISPLFDENNPAVTNMIASVIRDAKRSQINIGLCGQAPSDFPEFTRFLVEQGIDSISFNADALLNGLQNILKAEANRPSRA